MKVGDKKRVKESYSDEWFNVGDIVTITQISTNEVWATGSTSKPYDSWSILTEHLEDIPSEITHKVGDHVKVNSVHRTEHYDLIGTTLVINRISPENQYPIQAGGFWFQLQQLDIIERPKDEKDVSVSEGGSLRYNKGKPEFSHLSPKFILAMADLMTKSAEKYSRQNWLMKQDLRTASDSLFRHFTSFMSGEDNDSDSGKSHLLHLAVNAMIMWENYEQFGEEVDNRFYKTLEEKLDE